DMHRVNLSRKRILDKLDELALDPVFAEQVPAEKAREERYSQFPKGGGERRDGGGRDRGDRDRGDRGHDRSRGGSSDGDRQGRPVRRFERDRKN
ncbi:MAG: polyribonucleotide nucleotidyltransferase, partial [Cloacibacillus sp.]|nr:polyribonucleotide nucleotidyltransferase [Cloacibacillus sp.]